VSYRNFICEFALSQRWCGVEFWQEKFTLFDKNIYAKTS
jgi:hypothetical protein